MRQNVPVTPHLRQDILNIQVSGVEMKSAVTINKRETKFSKVKTSPDLGFTCLISE